MWRPRLMAGRLKLFCLLAILSAAQAWGACTISFTSSAILEPNINTFDSKPAPGALIGGGLTVSADNTCGPFWTITSNAAWITFNGGTTGSGPSQVTYFVASNTGAPRSGTITATFS